MYPHRIRLRGPWECDVLSLTAGDPPPARLTMPATLDGVVGTVRLRRRFGYPGTIDAHERVWLTFAAIRGEAAVSINGTALGPVASGAELDVTALLRPRNELLVEMSGPSPGLPGEVALEVRATAYLKDVTARFEAGTITARGRVVGTAPSPLDVYLIAGRRTLAYAAVTASEAGTRFELRGPEDGEPVGPLPGEGEVKVELVSGAVIWYSNPLALNAEG